MLISGEPVLVCTSSNYLLIRITTFLVWITNHFWWFKILYFALIFFYNCCVFMHLIVAMSIVFGLGFLCIASEYIFLNHQKWYVVLCFVIIRFSFVSIEFCTLCFPLELLFRHQVAGYCFSFSLCFALELLIAHQVVENCFSFWFVFIALFGIWSMVGHVHPKCGRRCFVCEERGRKACRR